MRFFGLCMEQLPKNSVSTFWDRFPVEFFQLIHICQFCLTSSHKQMLTGRGTGWWQTERCVALPFLFPKTVGEGGGAGWDSGSQLSTDLSSSLSFSTSVTKGAFGNCWLLDCSSSAGEFSNGHQYWGARALPSGREAREHPSSKCASDRRVVCSARHLFILQCNVYFDLYRQHWSFYFHVRRTNGSIGIPSKIRSRAKHISWLY